MPHRPEPPTLSRTLAVVAALAVLLACGPNFPNRLLLSGDAAVLSAPSAEFKREIDRITPRPTVLFRALPPDPASDVYRQSIDADVADLRAALGPGGSNVLITAYTAWRTAITQPDANPLTFPPLPTGLPTEFDLYARGLLSHTSGKPAEARDSFSRLLALPPTERRWRSVWAAFMTGKSFLTDSPKDSIAWFQKTRELASSGFTDRIGLASSSLGWEAQAELTLNNIPRACALYLQHHISGDPTAIQSLRTVAAKIAASITSVATLDAHARDPLVQRIITSFLMTRGGPPSSFRPIPRDFTSAWLGALERTGAVDVKAADRIAWISYQSGDMPGTRRWLALCAETPLAQWLTAKLLLRDGKPDEAAALLAKVSRTFPTDDSWELKGDFEDAPDYTVRPARLALGEAGVILLSRRQYTEALDALLRSGFWCDAAYVAERVLTVDELRSYIDRVWPRAPEPPEGDDSTWGNSLSPEHAALRLRYLLARRLARLSRFDQAALYMPKDKQAALKRLADSMSRGRDTSKSPTLRADALWKAAQITRASGLELVGTELSPDCFVYSGQFSLRDDGTQRAKLKATHVPADPDEIKRSAATAPDPDDRYHYRYTAAKLAWEAAELMPDQDEATATVLNTAGSWIKDLNPKAADRFYKALVKRCGRTELGAQAAKLHWFPKSDEPSK